MRFSCRIAVLGAIACILTSCASTPARGPVTVELFDSPSISPTMERPNEVVYQLASPVVPEAPSVAASIESPLMGVALAQPDVSVLSLPDAPVTVMRPDFGFMTPPSPRVRATFTLATPDAPAATLASAATSTAAKPASAASQARSTLPTQPKAQTAAGASASATQPRASAVPASGTTAAPATNAATSTATPSTASPGASLPSYGNLREIYARIGDELQIGLDGLGFLFLGFPDASLQANGMSFKAKENRANKTWFTFQALKLGTYDLDFLQQDNTTGKSVKETVRVHVVSDQDFSSATQQQAGTDTGSQETGDPTYADTLTALGQYQAAVSELMKGYTDGNPNLNDQIAALYMRMNSYDAAAKFYTKNLSPQNQFTSRAVNGLMRVAVFQKDQQALMSGLKQFLALKDSGTEETFILAARMERDTGQIGVGLELLATYASRFPNGAFRDEADFIAAQMLEADSQFRNIAQARDLYNAILTDYPESSFAESARQRVQYIERHFFQVR
jgi:hypothetical protein